MSEAMQLLNSLNLEDYMDPNPVNDILVIDAEKRTIVLPSSELIFGVESDGDVERKYFKCPRIVGDNIDLNTLSLRVHYQNAGNEKDIYIVEDVAVDGEFITFSWLLSKKVLRYKGTVQFTLVAVKVNDDGTTTQEWNTTIASGTVLEGMSVEGAYDDDEDILDGDVLHQLLNMSDRLEAALDHIIAIQEALIGGDV